MALAGDRITRIVAILNGTTNAVLSRMEATGCALDEALAGRARARLRGSGSVGRSRRRRRGAKLAILCALAFGVRVDPSRDRARSTSASHRGERARAARARGGTIRQIAHAEFDAPRSALTAWVAPIEVVARLAVRPRRRRAERGAHHRPALPATSGIFGAGAGGDATAVAILGDLAAIARDKAAIVPPPVS